MKLENVLKVMAAVTAMLVACSEVLNQANQYYNLRKDEVKDNKDNTTADTTTTSTAE